MASTSTAQLGSSPAWLASLRERLTPAARTDGRTATNGRVYALLAAAALALGALSLLYPSTPTYDPWAWIIWGREIVHIDLQTTGGPSWKPLPVLFTMVFSLFGGAAPDLWLMVARGGAILAVMFAFRLAARLTGRWGVPAVTAGVVGAVALIISSQFVRTMSLGNSEGLLVAATLWGIERHLDGKYRQAFVLGFVAALLRPEVWPFLGLYGAWLWLIDRKALWLILSGFILIPVLWFLPELWGSGNLMRAADRAKQPNPNSPAFARHPFVKVIQDTWPLVITPVKAAAAFALVLAAIDWVRKRRQGAVLAIGLLAIAWIVLIAGMTQAGFSGNPRYIILGTSMLAVIGGVGFGRVVQFVGDAVGSRFGARGTVAAGGLAFVLLALATAHWAAPRFRNFDDLDRALRYQAELRHDLGDALAKAGGASAYRSCGHATAGKFSVPLVAWYLHEHTLDVGLFPTPQGVIVAARTTNNRRLIPQPQQPYPPGYKPVATVRTTTLFSTCPATPGA
jgi:MFS family permease